MHRRSRGSSPRRVRLATAAAALFGTVALAGCGGSGDADDLTEKGKTTAAKDTPTGAGDGKGDPDGGAKATGAGKSPTPTGKSTGASPAPLLPTGTKSASGFPPPREPMSPPTTSRALPDPGAVPKVPGTVAYQVTQQHVVEPVVYDVSPPVGGAHDQVWANCGVYRQELPARNAVHSMEHGAVWVTYRPDLPKDQVTALENALRGKPYVLLSPYPGLRTPVVASAWGFQLGLDRLGDPRLEQFVTTYANGPQTPEKGAVCTGGAGRP